MRSRLFVFASALAFSTTSVSCPRSDEAPAALVAPISAAQESPLSAEPANAEPVSVEPTNTEPASAAVVVDPGMLATLPPELLDDGSDDLPEPEPEPDPAPEKPTARPPERPRLASIAKEAWVYAEPLWKARRIGYLRAGAIAGRERAPVAKNAACPGGWYRIEPKGYVCAGAAATLDASHPVVDISSRRPSREGLPYTYVMSRMPPP